MHWIVEFDGVIADVLPCQYQVHRQVAEGVGWSSLDQDTFRRLTRTKGADANLLPGAKPIKIKNYHIGIAEIIENDSSIARFVIQPDMDGFLANLVRYGTCRCVTLGTNLDARRRLIENKPFFQHISQMDKLDADPRSRPAELTELADHDPKAVVIASSDVVIRSADEAELFTIGLSTGLCTPARLHGAGARIVYKSLNELTDSLGTGSEDLVQAGMSNQLCKQQ